MNYETYVGMMVLKMGVGGLDCIVSCRGGAALLESLALRYLP